jgi:hypothetical protein
MEKIDKRTLNGGNSTVSKGVDKRKNEYKTALDSASDVYDVVSVITKVKDKALEGDLNACKLFLEYYLGKPTQTINQSTDLNINDFNLKEVLKFDNLK